MFKILDFLISGKIFVNKFTFSWILTLKAIYTFLDTLGHGYIYHYHMICYNNDFRYNWGLLDVVLKCFAIGGFIVDFMIFKNLLSCSSVNCSHNSPE